MYRKITPEQAKQIIDSENVVILDVRTESEFNSKHIENAVLIPLDSIKQKANEILTDKNTKILVYCRSGIRSEKASRELVSMGYENIFDFGGIINWKYK